jgi:hypothetical protein
MHEGTLHRSFLVTITGWGLETRQGTKLPLNPFNSNCFLKEPYRHKYHKDHVEEIGQLLGSKEMQLVM